MSFDKVLGTDDEITDPKLKKLLERTKGIKSSTRPDIELVERKVHKPSKTIKLVFDGVEKKPEGEVLEVYRCNKCKQNFNHPHAKVVAGVLPQCPSCD